MRQFLCWLGILTILDLLHRAPVPNPGMTTDTYDHSGTASQQKRLYECQGFRFSGHQGEGYCGSIPTVGADSWITAFCQGSAKNGKQPPMSSSSNRPTAPFTAVQKRSYKRACRRAILNGFSHYHGHRMQVEDFPPALVQKLQSEFKPPRGPQTYKTAVPCKGRLTCLHWNPGGLAQTTLAEIRLWLQRHPVDIVVLTETRWSFSATWSDKAWIYVHSASADYKSGGILIMISRRLACPEQIGHQAIVDGRLVHVRVHFDSRALDILAIYQHVDSRNKLSAQQREQIWDALNTALDKQPSRNNLICAGDFNCSLDSHPPWIGTSSYKWHGRMTTGSTHRDQARLQGILKLHGLTAINTWGASGATYVHGETTSRIDHFLIKLLASDGISKQVQFLTDADFVPANSTHHIPILCNVRAKHMAYQTYDRPTSCTYMQRSQCRIAGLQETQAWHDLRQQVVTAVHADHQALSPEALIQKIHDQVSIAFHQFFSPKNPPVTQADLSVVHQTIVDKWHFKKQLWHLANTGRVNLSTMMQAWHHRSRYQVLQRTQQKALRQARKEQFQALCHEVSNAAHVHDTHSMFNIINRFAPKRPLTRARLRGPDGTIADQYMAHSLTVAFVKQMWQGPSRLPTFFDAPPGIPFELAELADAVAKVHTNKSVAQPFLPGVVWRSAPWEVASFVYSLLQDWWSQSPPIIPKNWKDSWLFFLPKPGKPNTHPDQLRPISLMEPLGKIVMGLITIKIKACIFPLLNQLPQFGFLPYRAATDAILRVSRHSRCVREMVAANRRTTKNQIDNQAKLTICGGLSLFLDLNRAFDSADRCAIFEHLIQLGTPPNLVQLAASWHEDTHYNLSFRGTTTSIPVGKGLRQGCKLAPPVVG